MEVLAFGHGTVCFVSIELGALVLSLRLFFVKNLLSSWWTGVDVALALILARPLLRGCCPFVSRGLPPVLCGDGAGPSLTRACSPWTYHCLRLGDWSLGLASSSVFLPSAAFPWDGTVGGSCMSPHFEMMSVLNSWKYRISFLRNLSFLLR